MPNRKSWRSYAPWLLGVAGIILVLWGVSAAIERMASRPGVGASSAIQPATRLLTGAPAQIDVKVLDDQGKAYPLGTPLPRQLSLMIRNAEGQEFSVPFDRVGVWAVDAPDGAYSIPEDQKGLGNWSWKMSGEGVKKDGKTRAWMAEIRKEGRPVVLGITLY